jgi:histidyl-tRNA synthetase
MIVRGLDYYTRTAFEVHYPALGAQSALGGGGRYDGLVEACGGPPTPAVGFSGGLERILYALEHTRSETLPRAIAPPVVLLPLGDEARREALRLARHLRRHVPASVDLTGRSLKAQLRSAGRSGAKVALILGEAEVQSRQVLVRDLAAGEQAPVSQEEAIDVVRRILQAAGGGET